MAVTSIAAAIQKYDLALLGGAHEIRERDRTHKGGEIAAILIAAVSLPVCSPLLFSRAHPRLRHPEGEPHHDQHRLRPSPAPCPRQQRQPTTIAARPPASGNLKQCVA